MLAEMILRGEADQELTEIMASVVKRVSEKDISMTPERYTRTRFDMQSRLLEILGSVRQLEEEGRSDYEVVLITGAEIQALMARMERILNGME